jgi:hypothetical protein
MWACEGYPIQPGIPKSHLPEKLPRSNLNVLYCKLIVSIGSQVRSRGFIIAKVLCMTINSATLLSQQITADTIRLARLLPLPFHQNPSLLSTSPNPQYPHSSICIVLHFSSPLSPSSIYPQLLLSTAISCHRPWSCHEEWSGD